MTDHKDIPERVAARLLGQIYCEKCREIRKEHANYYRRGHPAQLLRLCEDCYGQASQSFTYFHNRDFRH